MRRPPPLAPLVAWAVLAAAARSEAADDPGAGRARAQAQQMYEAFVGGDMDGFVQYMHPRVIRLAGGKGKIISMMKNLMAEMRSNGLVIRGASVAAAQQIVRPRAGVAQAILPMDLLVDGNGKRYRQPSFLLGLSSDGGQTWKFADTGQIGGDAIRKVFPECSPSLKIPARPRGFVTE
jgi:hypothetical protein